MPAEIKTDLPPEAKLNIIIVGAGLGGLGASISCALSGHSVTVLESASTLGEIGAGIQVLPNSSRVLTHWGLKPALLAQAMLPKQANLINYKGEWLSKLVFEESAEKWNPGAGTGYWDFHRADLHRCLIQRAEELGAVIRCGVKVVNVEFHDEDGDGGGEEGRVSVVLSDGTKMRADLVVGADGIHSRMREVLTGKKEPPKRTGDLAYRLLLDTEKLMEDEELKQLVLEKEVNYWIGPGAHVVTYMLRNSSMCNMVLLVPDDMPEDGPSTIAGNVSEMRSLFTNWDPRIQRLLLHCTNVQRWRLCIVTPLPTWYHPTGTFVLLGDSVHATLPYLASGAGMSFEDAAVLGECLGKIKNKSNEEMRRAMRVYERCRKERTEMVVERGNLQQVLYHLDDGEEQRERDRKLRVNGEAVRDEDMEENEALVWRDPVMAPKLLGYDFLEDVEKHWKLVVEEEKISESKL